MLVIIDRYSFVFVQIHIRRDYHNELTPIHYAIKFGNIELLEILLEDIKSPKADRCPLPEITMARQSTGKSVSLLVFFAVLNYDFLC